MNVYFLQNLMKEICERVADSVAPVVAKVLKETTHEKKTADEQKGRISYVCSV